MFAQVEHMLGRFEARSHADRQCTESLTKHAYVVCA